MKISKVLVANRGEIAVRVIRAAKDSGILTVAIYADQDRNSRFVRMAHEAYALNGTTALDTYLKAEKILSIAKRSGANAIHPGYGFLSENSDFAQMVIDADLLWIGPSPESIRALGDKVSARRIARKVGAPLAPGTVEPVQTVNEVTKFAREHGLPIAIKAAHGGGGRGLRVAHALRDIPEMFDAASREALAAFGRGECFVEKFLDQPRHVETQCLADSYGKVVVVSTRDCTLQRRHQKLVEEAPAPFLQAEQEKLLYDSSKAILAEAGYTGAGTCEFLIGKDGTVSFLEVNTRLQVEHPVSEEVTGLDLVREQFRIAEGEQIGYEDPAVEGHSIEFRINGEDPGQDFMPIPGSIHSMKLPGGYGIRIDSGVTTGDIVSSSFDSLLAKLIVTGRNREDAITKARRALAEFEITGIPTVIPFHRWVIDEQAFCGEKGNDFSIHTQWIDNEFSGKVKPWSGNLEDHDVVDETYRTVVVEVEGRRLRVGVPSSLFAKETGKGGGRAPRRLAKPVAQEMAEGNLVISKMQGTVVKVMTTAGAKVLEGEVLCVIEAMKMEQPVKCPRDGHLAVFNAAVGDTVQVGTLIAEIR